MAYDPEIDAMVELVLAAESFAKRKMFGGTCYLLNGRMVCGVYKEYLMAKVGRDNAAAAINAGQAEPCAVSGRPMANWILVPKTVLSQAVTAAWIELAREHAATMEPEQSA